MRPAQDFRSEGSLEIAPVFPFSALAQESGPWLHAMPFLNPPHPAPRDPDCNSPVAPPWLLFWSPSCPEVSQRLLGEAFFEWFSVVSNGCIHSSMYRTHQGTSRHCLGWSDSAGLRLLILPADQIWVPEALRCFFQILFNHRLPLAGDGHPSLLTWSVGLWLPGPNTHPTQLSTRLSTLRSLRTGEIPIPSAHKDLSRRGLHSFFLTA